MIGANPLSCLICSEEEADLAQTWSRADTGRETRAEWQPALHQGVAESNLSQVGTCVPLLPALS